jgi:hypothetical protein
LALEVFLKDFSGAALMVLRAFDYNVLGVVDRSKLMA